MPRVSRYLNDDEFLTMLASQTKQNQHTTNYKHQTAIARVMNPNSMMISLQRSVTSQRREYSSSILPDRQAKTSAAGSQTERRWLKR